MNWPANIPSNSPIVPDQTEDLRPSALWLPENQTCVVCDRWVASDRPWTIAVGTDSLGIAHADCMTAPKNWTLCLPPRLQAAPPPQKI